VRDLASGRNLLWLPVRDATATTACNAIDELVAEHGAPLVLKSDNGSAFVAEKFVKLLAEYGVKNLFSPPRTPQYNGSVEAGIGSLTCRTNQNATRHGHPGYWTWDDVEAARLEANATSRPRGTRGPSCDELWASRTRITTEQRERFQVAVEEKLKEDVTCSSQGTAKASSNCDAPVNRVTQRSAVSSALVEQGYLHYLRKRIPLPIPRRKTAIFT
jgi:hypothetical protein